MGKRIAALIKIRILNNTSDLFTLFGLCLRALARVGISCSVRQQSTNQSLIPRCRCLDLEKPLHNHLPQVESRSGDKVLGPDNCFLLNNDNKSSSSSSIYY